MTLTARAVDQGFAADAVSVSRRDWMTWLATVAIIFGAYLLLQNPFWVPGGDSEVYTSIARSLAQGRGYRFNGQPVSMEPPGWPIVMALAMRVSPTFALLKFIDMSCMLGSLAILYWVCRRFASPKISAIVILLSAILSHIYLLTIWLHCDSLFCLVSSAALLVAFQISEGKTTWWRGVLLVLLCGLAVVVRWAGLLSWLMVGAVLLKGEFWPRFNDRWIRAIATGIIAFGTLVTLRAALEVPPDVQKAIKEFGGTGEDSGAVPDTTDKTLAASYPWWQQSKGISGYFIRAATWGNWFSYLLWQPFRLSNTLLTIMSLILGWMAIAAIAIVAWIGARSKQWMWLAILIYSLGLALNWSHPTPRYLVPIAPLIILGIFNGLAAAPEFISRWRFDRSKLQRICTVLFWCFVISYIACNGALYAVDVYVARSQKFYDVYEAGMDKDLIYACHWLNDHPPADGEIAVAEQYTNMGHVRPSPFGLRATAMLTGKALVSCKMRYTRTGDPRKNPYFLNWARVLGVKYLLYQPEVSPWRVFHFRMGWLQKIMTHEEPVDTGAGWRLYRIPPKGDEAIRVSLDPYPNWPTRVPGM
jgi:hypothetical protein